jgi:hypothetical protein
MPKKRSLPPKVLWSFRPASRSKRGLRKGCFSYRDILSRAGFTLERYTFSMTRGTESMTVGLTSARAGRRAVAEGGLSR